MQNATTASSGNSHFLKEIIGEDLRNGQCPNGICTRFPPEPNGYLHIGSGYAIHINYGLAEEYGGRFHLRFDDTNPLKEDMEYVRSIIEDLKWLGCDPGEHIYYGSDYSERIYQYAVRLVELGIAYVCDLTADEMHDYRGTLTEPGRESPYRNRSIAENLTLLEGMKNGDFPTGSKTLRARIDMASPNMNLRDPVLYRIIHTPHYRTGDDWCIYPMYDFAHPLQDAIEGISHSLCSIEFKDHRPLYEWVLGTLGLSSNLPSPDSQTTSGNQPVYGPKQLEFGRLNLTGTVTSKRYLRQLVAEGHVEGWDDPRLPTFKGLRRRGFTPESIKQFFKRIGVARNSTTVDISLLELALREELKGTAPCVMAVLRPLRVVLTNYPEGQTEELLLDNHPDNPAIGKRTVLLGRELYIEQEDFMEVPPGGYQRLTPCREVRLKGAYLITCQEVVKDPATGEIVELLCTYDPDTKSGTGHTTRKVKGVLHWVAACEAVEADVRLFGKLLRDGQELVQEEKPDWSARLNPESLYELTGCMVEPMLAQALPEDKYQFMRQGYFCTDSRLSKPGRPVFNRIVPLKDSWKGGSKA